MVIQWMTIGSMQVNTLVFRKKLHKCVKCEDLIFFCAEVPTPEAKEIRSCIHGFCPSSLDQKKGMPCLKCCAQLSVL